MGIKISELNEYNQAVDDDFLIIVDTKNLATKKITKANLLKELLAELETLESKTDGKINALRSEINNEIVISKEEWKVTIDNMQIDINRMRNELNQLTNRIKNLESV